MKMSSIICYNKQKDKFWVRIFGYGIDGKNVKTHGLKFSERIGKTKHLKIGNWSFSFLKKWS